MFRFGEKPMKKLVKKLVALVCLCVAFVATPVFSDDYQKGMDAYNKGDYKNALREWRALAEQGDARGQSGLGVMYQNGKGVPQDYAEAMKWHRLSAEQGNTQAQFFLSSFYALGQSVPQNYARAYMWASISALNGDKNGWKAKNTLLKGMTSLQIAYGRSLLQECIEKDYKGC